MKAIFYASCKDLINIKNVLLCSWSQRQPEYVGMSNRAPENDEEKLIRTVREALLAKWIHEGLEDKEVVELARHQVSAKTVENFRRYRTKPRLQTVVIIAKALRLRIAVVEETAPEQPQEVHVSAAMKQRLRKAAIID